MNIFKLFIAKYGNLTSANDRQIQKYLIATWDEDNKLIDVSKSAYVSNASISRFIKKMRLVSYKEFVRQKRFNRQYLTDEINYNKVFDEVIDKKKKLLDEVIKNIDEQKLLMASSAISEAEMVYIIGHGYSRLHADAICMRFNRIGKKAIYIDNMQKLPFLNETHQPSKCVCLAISQTGNTSTVNKLSKHFVDLNVKVISIVCEAKSKLEQISNITVFVPKIYSGMYLEAIYSEVTVNAILDFIYCYHLFENYEQSLENYNQSVKYY